MKFLEKLAALGQNLEAGGPPFHAPLEIIQIVHGARWMGIRRGPEADPVHRRAEQLRKGHEEHEESSRIWRTVPSPPVLQGCPARANRVTL
jgi:hypothetical protein